jgi:tetratricopeptide (TPR) repeat protein
MVMATDFQAVSSTQSNGAARLFEKGRRLFDEGRLIESERVFDQAAAQGGDRSSADYLAGVARLKLGDLDGAGERFGRAVDADPANADALYGLGVVAEGAGADAAAVTLYERALAANPGHADAARKLRQHRAEAGLARRWGVYAYILTDKSPLARKSLRLMESLRRKGRPSMVAYFGRYFFHFVILAVALTVLAVAGPQPETETAAAVPWAAISMAIGLFVVGVFCIRVLTTEVELDKGRLQVERGILNKRRTSIELWRIRDVELRRPLVNRLTRDGTLVLSLSPSGASRLPGRRGQGRIRVTGLLRGRRLGESYQDLLNLVFVLRSNAQVKGIIE